VPRIPEGMEVAKPEDSRTEKERADDDPGTGAGTGIQNPTPNPMDGLAYIGTIRVDHSLRKGLLLVSLERAIQKSLNHVFLQYICLDIFTPNPTKRARPAQGKRQQHQPAGIHQE
jgi:hypothetical protein